MTGAEAIALMAPSYSITMSICGVAEATPVSLGVAPAAVAGRIDYEGDTDVFGISVPAAGTLIVRSWGGTDTVGLLLDAGGERIASNDDAQTSGVDFGLTQRVGPGMHYLAVTRWESAGTGPYALSVELSPVTENYTDLWWNPEESGWGINFTHQGDIVFATLFTYAADGRPLWFVMSRGDRVPGTRIFEGALYRTAGPPFDASPWRPITYREVGRMQVAFTDGKSATLAYSVDGIEVRKQIVRQVFAVPFPECESDD